MKSMCRLYITISALLILSAPSWARERAQGYCQQGAVSVSITSLSGYATTPKVLGALPSCTVTVYLAGTTTPAALYGDTNGTTKSNPFTADSTGLWFFYADNGHYDVVMSGSGMPTTTQGDRLLSDLSGTNAAGQINYQRLNTGTVRTIQSKLDEQASVLDYGAKGDGTTDDRLAIQAALNAMASSCGTVLFPAGHTYLIASNPNNTTLLTYPPCVSMDGGGTIRLASGLGLFQSVFKCAVALQPAIIHNLTIDMNGTGNQITTDPGTTNYQMTFWFVAPPPTGSGLTLEDLTFQNGHGIWTLNTYADSVTVNRCRWENWGVGVAFWYDTSLLYIAGDGGTVTNNTFIGAGSAAHTAIEVHASNKVIANNVIKNFFAGIIYSSDTNGGTALNIAISNNIINNVWYGIQFWANDGGINGLAITGNAVTINRNYNYSLWSTSAGGGEVGIGTYVLSHYPLSNLTITGNTINWTAETGSYPTNSFQVGIGLNTSTTAPGGPISSAVIADNAISGTAASGIGIASGSTISGLVIKGNTILNPGRSAIPNQNFRDGIMLVSTPSWVNSAIINNIMTDTQATPTMQRGILWGGVAGDNAGTQVTMRGNQVRYTGTPIQYFNIQSSSPYFDVEVPGYATNSALLSLSSFTTGNYPPIYSAITDPLAGRVWHNVSGANPAQPPYFNSQELRDTIPTTGSYKQGDIVWSSDSAIGGFAGWVSVLTGSPGTFAKIPLTNAGSNSPFTSNVNGPSFNVTGGTSPVYRCLTGGALPVGALTTLPGTCGTSQTVGLTVQ